MTKIIRTKQNLLELIYKNENTLKDFYSNDFDDTVAEWIEQESCTSAINKTLIEDLEVAIKEYPEKKEHYNYIVDACKLPEKTINTIISSMTPGVECDMDECVFQLCQALKRDIALKNN